MKFKSNSHVTRGMIFAGCSFTWGSGLHYYTNLPSVKEPTPNKHLSWLCKWSHLEFIKSKRFPRLIANHFNTFEMCQPFNGGTPPQINGWWKNAFSKSSDDFNETSDTWQPGPTKSIVSMGPSTNDYEQLYDYQDFSHIIYQFTQWQRDVSFVTTEPTDFFNGHRQYGPVTHFQTIGTEEYNNWLIERNWTHDDYVYAGREKVVTDTITFLNDFISNGVKVYVITWPWEMLPNIKSNPWFNDKLIEFDYKGEHYSNITELMQYNKELMISTDYDNFDEPPQDEHPSLLCHQVIAENIIKKLESDCDLR